MGKVNVQARIIARKVTFSFMYAHIFLFKWKKIEIDKENKNRKKVESDININININDDGHSKIINKVWDNSFVSNMFTDSSKDNENLTINDEKTSKEEFFFSFSVDDLSKNYLEEAAEYILDQFFSYNKTPTIDMSYFLEVASKIFDYKEEVFDKINTFTSTFSIERMDVSDQCIFVIAYTEWKVLWTPKEVLLNEMIELAKRYWDEWSPKLVNGILHKIIS